MIYFVCNDNVCNENEPILISNSQLILDIKYVLDRVSDAMQLCIKIYNL